jgi:glutathione S-transferase
MYGLPNPSPFCMKLETYLRLAGIEHRVETIGARIKSPTGKAPFIDIDGKVMADSGLIINHLEASHGHPVDGKLTLAERGQSLAFQRMMEEHLYWVVVYMRWIDPATENARRGYLQELLGLPALLTPFVARAAARRIKKRLDAHGIGRHPPEVIWQMGIADVQALAHWLGNRAWGFGDTPTTFDACLAAAVGNILRTSWPNPLTAATAKHSNLVAHVERLMARCFPELAR